MGRVRSSWMWFGILLGLFALLGALAGCGGKTATVAPKTLKISPAVISLEQGGTFSSLSVVDSAGAAVPLNTIVWQASNPAALTVAQQPGIATICAGTWDSLIAPTICTPGPAVEVQLTASAEGATSAPTSVFVHQHIERLVISQLGPPSTCGATSLIGLSAVSQNAPAGTVDYQVLAFNNGNDITSTVGPISWSVANTTVATFSTTAPGLLFNQARATAKTPGQTQFFASAGNATSTPITFTTCPVESITLATATGGNSLSLNKGSASQTITATVLDSAGLQLTNPPLTWSTTNPTVASVSATGVVAGLQTGGAGITASCFPTACNVGFSTPSVAPPVYPSAGISVSVGGTPSSSTVYVASSGCWDRTNGPILGCISSIIPIPQSTNKPGAAVALPHTPTSVIMSPIGNNIYIGSCVPRTPPPGQPVCNGIAVVTSAAAVTTNNSVTGDVVGVSVNGDKAVVSDTSTTPNQVFLYDQPTNAGTQLILAPTDHAKSAVFSPDGFQVYITTFRCTASPCQTLNEVPGPLYVFDPVNRLRLLPTPAGVIDIALHPSGAFAYMAQAANSVTVLDTCNTQIATDKVGVQQIKPTPGAPQFIRALPDGTHFIAMNGPNATGLEVITATTAGLGCPPMPVSPPPLLTNTVSNTVGPLVDLNQGPIATTQFLLSTDGLTAYVVPQNFSSVFSYDVLTGGRTGIALVGAQPPTTGGLTSDGAVLYVGSADGLLHLLNTSSLVDEQQIMPVSNSTPPTSMCSIPGATPCTPDFVVVKP
jgi:hypothetical protein